MTCRHARKKQPAATAGRPAAWLHFCASESKCRVPQCTAPVYNGLAWRPIAGYCINLPIQCKPSLSCSDYLSIYIYIYAYNNFPKFTGLGCHTQEDLSILALGSRLYIIDPVWPQCMNQSVSPGFYLINIADSSAQILLEKQARNILCASLNVPRQATQNVSLVPYAILMQTIHKHLAHRM